MVENYTLTSKDYEWLKGLIQTTESIETIYNKLCELETNGQKDSEEYRKYIDYLKMSLEVESDIYSSAKLDFNRGSAIYNYIVEDRIPEGTLTDKESLIAQNYDYRVLKRILGALKKIIVTDYKTIQEQMMPSGLVQLMRDIGMSNVDQRVSNAVFSGVSLKSSMDQDIMRGFLSFVGDLTINSRYEEYRPNLIATKYNAAFLDKDAEADLLENSFEIADGFFSNANLTGGLVETPQALLDVLKNHEGFQEAAHQLGFLVKMHDAEFEDKNKAYGALLRQCFLRSAFLLMDEEALSKLNYYFHDFVESPRYLEDHKDDSIGELKVTECFRKINQDKKKLDGGTQFGTL